MAEPVITIAKGLSLAFAAGKDLYVARGVYEESADVTVSMYGGYEEQAWHRDVTAYETKIVAPAGLDAMTIPATGRAPAVTVDGFTAQGGAGSDGMTVAGVRTAGDHVTLRRNSLQGADQFILRFGEIHRRAH
ncbi:MAG: hypothetical protein M5R36_25615 [Deltaproteobacteria bacterium]|nr:hypothetical protein [Deltaproteobacteria bacterium]